jgi:hypothetical protein
MKKFINEILKPTSIFAVYMVAVAFIANIIGIYFYTDTSIVTGILFLITYPIYIKFIDN